MGEDEVDDLLRNGVLVDLYPLVRKSIRVGAESFSLKALEPLYMGSQLRSGDVTTATDSITSYARYCELAGRRPRRRRRHRAQGDRGVQPLRLPVDPQAARLADDARLGIRRRHRWARNRFPSSDTIKDHDQLASALAKFAGDTAAGDRTPEQTAVALVAAARGYHRREDKPFWWSHFDRLNYPVDEWSDNTDVFVVDNASVAVDWHTPPRARKPQRRVRLTGELARGELNDRVFALYEPPAPPGMTDNPDRRAAGTPRWSRSTTRAVPTDVVIVERTGSDGNTFHQLPFALTPGPPVPTTAAAGFDRIDRAARGRRVAATAPHRAGRRAAAAPTPHPQRRPRCRAAPTPSPTSPPRR